MAKNTTDAAEGVAEEKTATAEPPAPVADVTAPAAPAIDEIHTVGSGVTSEPDHPDARRQAFLGRITALKSRAQLASRQHDLQGLAGVMAEFFDLVADQAR